LIAPSAVTSTPIGDLPSAAIVLKRRRSSDGLNRHRFLDMGMPPQLKLADPFAAGVSGYSGSTGGPYGYRLKDPILSQSARYLRKFQFPQQKPPICSAT